MLPRRQAEWSEKWKRCSITQSQSCTEWAWNQTKATPPSHTHTHTHTVQPGVSAISRVWEVKWKPDHLVPTYITDWIRADLCRPECLLPAASLLIRGNGHLLVEDAEEENSNQWRVDLGSSATVEILFCPCKFLLLFVLFFKDRCLCFLVWFQAHYVFTSRSSASWVPRLQVCTSQSVYALLGIEPRASCTPGKHSSDWATASGQVA